MTWRLAIVAFVLVLLAVPALGSEAEALDVEVRLEPAQQADVYR